jgi:hypothetical protein
VAATAALVLLAGAMLAANLGWDAHEWASRRDKTEQVVNEALKEAASWQERRRLPETLAAARRAERLVASGTATEPLRRAVRAQPADLELLEKLENVPLEKTAVKDGHFDTQRAEDLYGQVFRDAGLDVQALPAAAAARIRRCRVAVELAAVLDD